MKSNKLLHISTAFLPHYRAPVYSLINTTYTCRWLVGNDYKYAKSIKKIELDVNWNVYEYRVIYIGKLSYNVGWYKNILVDHLIVIPLPNSISDWLLLLSRKLSKKETTVWTQGPNYSDGVLKIFYKTSLAVLADNILTYNNYAKNIFVKGFKRKNIEVIYNSLNGNVGSKKSGKDLLYIGRILPDRNLEFIIKYIGTYSDRALHIVGDGEYRLRLEVMANDLSMNVFFYGEMYEIPESIYEKCGYGIVPGHSGLNILKYIENGLVPVTHNNCELHMPEYEILEQVSRHVTYDFNSLQSLKSTLTSLDRNIKLSESVFESLKFEIVSKWNPRNQLRIVEKYL